MLDDQLFLSLVAEATVHPVALLFMTPKESIAEEIFYAGIGLFYRA
jgi:hypothetical protein